MIDYLPLSQFPDIKQDVPPNEEEFSNQCLDLSSLLTSIGLSSERIDEILSLTNGWSINPETGAFNPLTGEQIQYFINKITNPESWPADLSLAETGVSISFVRGNDRIGINIGSSEGRFTIGATQIQPTSEFNLPEGELTYDSLLDSLIVEGYLFDTINFEVFTDQFQNGYKILIDIGHGPFQNMFEIALERKISLYNSNNDITEQYTETLSMEVLRTTNKDGEIRTETNYYYNLDRFDSNNDQDDQTVNQGRVENTFPFTQCTIPDDDNNINVYLPEGNLSAILFNSGNGRTLVIRNSNVNSVSL